MKQIVLALILALSLSLQSAPDSVFAQSEGCDTVFCGGGIDAGVSDTKDALEGSGIDTNATLIQAILFWVKVFLIIAGTLAFVAFVWAGFLFITSFANEENNEKAKKIMMYTGIGILVILFSYVLTNFFINAAV